MALTDDRPQQPRSPAPQHDPVFIWPTPNKADYLFWVEKNGDLPANKDFTYGDAYTGANAQKYPDHKLVFVSPQTTEKWSRWFYASDRINQDAYNWEFTQANLGGMQFDQVERLYFYKRSEFKHSDTSGAVDQGDAMPDVPAGSFPASDFILAERVTLEAPVEELRSLYILERRVYFLRATIGSVENDDMLGVGQGKVVTLYYRGETPPGADKPIEELILEPENSYWGLQGDGSVVNADQLTHRWFAVTVFSSLDAALEAYTLSFPSSVDLDIPDELVGVSTVWNVAGANGEFASNAAGRSAYVGDPEVALSLAESANAECGGSIQPEIVPNIRRRTGRDVPSVAKFFFIKATGGTLSSADVMTKAGVSNQWPIFQPVQHTVILKGQRGSARAQVSASGSVATQVSDDQERNNKEVSSAKGVSYDYSTSVGTVTLPPTIHPEITLSGTTSDSAVYTADCTVGWEASGTAATVATYDICLPIPANDGSAGVLDGGGTGEVAETATITLKGSVTPTVLPATTPDAIPVTGLYLVGAPRIEPYKAHWFQCHVQIVDASVFAP